MIARNVDRVEINTDQQINDLIQRQIEVNVEKYSRLGNMAIAQRLQELDEEWDIERYVETMAPILTLAGIALGIAANRKWLLLSAAVQSFFLQHAIQGWCPPIPVLRRLGVRTMQEINQERTALKALRGDFEGVSTHFEPGGTRQAMYAVMK